MVFRSFDTWSNYIQAEYSETLVEGDYHYLGIAQYSPQAQTGSLRIKYVAILMKIALLAQ